jgi:dTDP-4-dehydrorhamnose 3,5-epimerase-like enzyme
MNPLSTSVQGTAIYHEPIISDPRGSIAVREVGSGLPFTPQRCFITFNVPGQQVRGAHAHLSCHLLLVCLRGSLYCYIDDGRQNREIKLNSPEMGLYIAPMVWAKQYNYSPDAILQVFASEPYDSEDFLTDYEQFLAMRFAKIQVNES